MNTQQPGCSSVLVAAGFAVLAVVACASRPQGAQPAATQPAPMQLALQVVPGPVHADPPSQPGQQPTAIRGQYRLELLEIPGDVPRGTRFGGACLHFQPLGGAQACDSDAECGTLRDASTAVVGDAGVCGPPDGSAGARTCWWKPAVANPADQPCGRHPAVGPAAEPMQPDRVYHTAAFDSAGHGPRAWRLVACQWLDGQGCMGMAPEGKRLRWGPVWIPAVPDL